MLPTGRDHSHTATHMNTHHVHHVHTPIAFSPASRNRHRPTRDLGTVHTPQQQPWEISLDPVPISHIGRLSAHSNGFPALSLSSLLWGWLVIATFWLTLATLALPAGRLLALFSFFPQIDTRWPRLGSIVSASHTLFAFWRLSSFSCFRRQRQSDQSIHPLHVGIVWRYGRPLWCVPLPVALTPLLQMGLILLLL
ncbi:hypothetical protein BR93DRAFT_628251 [Coniochaeta sp. PMI_546]|nr:hypothetical protein BR93DRAFT_628251 [Coniochaeta sp. PMI_546]